MHHHYHELRKFQMFKAAATLSTEFYKTVQIFDINDIQAAVQIFRSKFATATADYLLLLSVQKISCCKFEIPFLNSLPNALLF